MEMDAKAVIAKARQVFDIEIEGLAAVRGRELGNAAKTAGFSRALLSMPRLAEDMRF